LIFPPYALQSIQLTDNIWSGTLIFSLDRTTSFPADGYTILVCFTAPWLVKAPQERLTTNSVSSTICVSSTSWRLMSRMSKSATAQPKPKAGSRTVVNDGNT
jgi:hypothetical protein